MKRQGGDGKFLPAKVSGDVHFTPLGRLALVRIRPPQEPSGRWFTGRENAHTLNVNRRRRIAVRSNEQVRVYRNCGESGVLERPQQAWG
ncbi:hypothetical protein [Pseudocitrobacter faecalis]|uniref:hypothetical protein n=1 Tax=Pseudocitrobacter faecalis TaxID=1398493 RepID=UPI0040634095